MKRHYFLEGFTDQDHLPQRYDLAQFPATVGRETSSDICVPNSRISRSHARFDLSGDRLTLTDLGSTNGSFVNRERITDATEVLGGDVLHFADQEFRLMTEEVSNRLSTDRFTETRMGINALPSQFPVQARDFHEMIEKGQVQSFRQAIVRPDGTPWACELLGRGSHPGLNDNPAELFRLAEALGEEVKLSRLFRKRGLADAARAGMEGPLFINTHPSECRQIDTLLAELSAIRSQYPQLALALEIHESAITDLGAMAEARNALHEMKIMLVYDDFGAGQARLLELTEVPPDVLKFDIALVRGITDTESPRFRLLSSLHAMIADLGIPTIAEGIELEETAVLCRQIGIDYFQGFLFDRPGPLAANEQAPSS